jgi:hypothetical protein
MAMSLCIEEIGDKNEYGGFDFKCVDHQYPEYESNGLSGAKDIATAGFEKIQIKSGHPIDCETCWRPKDFDQARNWIKSNGCYNVGHYLSLMDLLESNEKLYLFDSW